MGNKSTRNSRINQPYNQMVEDAISALKDHPNSTQNDVFDYLENKYDGRIPPKAKKNLEIVIRSVIKTKNSRRGRPARSVGRKVRFKAKLNGPVRHKLQAGKLKVKKLVTRPAGKDLKKKTHRGLTAGKSKLKLHRAKSGGHHRLLRRSVRRGVSRGVPRDSKPHCRPVSSARSGGSFGLPRSSNERSKRNRMF